MGKIKQITNHIICLPIRLYQTIISPVLPQCCRFYPSCSQYSLEAIKTYGLIQGVFKSFKRICRCHPWASGGYDPVQPAKEK